MIIPSKFNGFHGGVRRCFGGGGGGGGGDGGQGGDGGTGDAASAAGGAVGPGASGTGNGSGDGGGSGPGPGGPNDVYTPAYTNAANTGVSTNRGNVTGMNLSNTNTGGFNNSSVNTMQGVNPATTRPYPGSDQFFQPVYNSSYMNYARPATQFDTSTYGTQPVYSPARAWNDRNSGSAAGGQQVVNNAISNYFQQNPNSDINSTLAAMRGVGINRTDIQAAGGYNNYGPQTSAPSMQTQMQQQFNPYSNNSGFNGQLMTAGYGGFGSPMGGLSPYATNPFSYQQQSYQPQMQMQNPYSYQQPSYQQQYNPYQMQSPFSFQQPMQQAQPVIPRSSGPSQAIVGRSSQMRGTPNVMRRAEGGIASLVDDVE